MANENNQNSFLNFVQKNLIGFVAGAVITALVMLAMDKGNLSGFEIKKGKDGSFSLNMENQEIESDVLLEKIWGETFSRDGLKGYMREKGFFTKNDPALVDSVRSLARNSNNATLLRALASEQRGPWKKERQKADSAVVSAPGYMPDIPDSLVYTWGGSGMNGKQIRIVSSQGLRRIILTVNDGEMGNWIDDGQHRKSLYQMSLANYKRLFNDAKGKGKVWITPME